MTDMVKTFFGLKKMPFSKEIGERELFASESMREASARLAFALETDDMALVTGAPGSGKSSVLRSFSATLDSHSYPHVYITCERYKIGDIAKLALAGLKISPPFHAFAALDKLKKEVRRLNHEKGAKPILIIDEAQELPVTTLASMKNLTNYEMDSARCILIVLAGQAELAATLRLSQLESLARRIRLHCQIGNLSIEETSRYIVHQMKIAGVEKILFADEAVAQIFSITKGNISAINNICFNLLILGAVESKDIIGPSMVDQVCVGH